MPIARPTPRRTAIVASLAVLSVLGLAAARTAVLSAAPAATTRTPATTGQLEPSDRWLDGLKSKHRQFFDTPAPNGGIPLVHVLNYYETYNKAYGIKDADIDAVLTFYGSTTFHALTDAAWAKYQLGEFLGINDPASGKPATSNPWRAAPVILGHTLPNASLEALHARGATLIVCNNALQIFAGMLAAKRGLEAGDVYADLKANILPGVDLVPGMVVAVEQATRAGLSYHRQ